MFLYIKHVSELNLSRKTIGSAKVVSYSRKSADFVFPATCAREWAARWNLQTFILNIAIWTKLKDKTIKAQSRLKGRNVRIRIGTPTTILRTRQRLCTTFLRVRISFRSSYARKSQSCMRIRLKLNLKNQKNKQKFQKITPFSFIVTRSPFKILSEQSLSMNGFM